MAALPGESSISYDDFCFSNEMEHQMFLLSDSQYAERLQFQESLMSSLLAASQSPSSSSSAAITTPIRVCEICAEEKESEDMIRIQNCSHSFCSDCIARHVTTKVQERATLILCPSGDCRIVLEYGGIWARLPREVAAMWNDLLCESMIPALEKFYCPFRDCSAMMVREEDREGGERVTASECPECHRLFCASCHVGWHSGIGCEEFAKLNEDERGREDLMVRNLAMTKGWKRCPQCKFYVEKNQGCLHMTCRCGFQFCYACGATWTDNHGGCQP